MNGTDVSKPSGRHAFIVDDEMQIRTFVSKMLDNAGFIPMSSAEWRLWSQH